MIGGDGQRACLQRPRKDAAALVVDGPRSVEPAAATGDGAGDDDDFAPLIRRRTFNEGHVCDGRAPAPPEGARSPGNAGVSASVASSTSYVVAASAAYWWERLREQREAGASPSPPPGLASPGSLPPTPPAGSGGTGGVSSSSAVGVADHSDAGATSSASGTDGEGEGSSPPRLPVAVLAENGLLPPPPRPRGLSTSPNIVAAARRRASDAGKDSLVMKLHRTSMAEDLCASVARLLEQRALGPGGRAAGADSRGLRAAALRSVRAHFRGLPARYALSVEPADVLVHSRLMDEARRSGEPRLHLRLAAAASPAAAGATGGGEGRSAHVVVACKDGGELLDAITRALRRVSRRIVDADVMTSVDGIALDRFEIEVDAAAAERVGGDGIMAHILEALGGGGSSGSGVAAAGAAAAAGSNDGGGEGGRGFASNASPTAASAAEQQRHFEMPRSHAGSSSGPAEMATVATPQSALVRGGAGNKAPPAAPAKPVPAARSAAAAAAAPGGIAAAMGAAAAARAQGGYIQFEELTLLETVGSGRFSRTHRAYWRGEVVAVKVVDLQEDGGGAGARGEEERRLALAEFERELAIVRRLSHPNVCGFRGASVAPPPRRCCCLVFEFLENGTLADLLRRSRGGGTSRGLSRMGACRSHLDSARSFDLFSIAQEVAEGMRYLHQMAVLHRDLKSTNILLDGSGHARIVDFGLSCLSAPGRDLTAETGTYRWMAPEVIRHEPYSEAADVYSYGIVLWELVTREQPFAGLTPIQAAFAVARQGLRPTLPPNLPPALASLIRRCWHANPALRPSFAGVCAALPEVQEQLLSFEFAEGDAASVVSNSSSTAANSSGSSHGSLSGAAAGAAASREAAAAAGSSSGGGGCKREMEGTLALLEGSGLAPASRSGRSGVARST